MSRLVLITGPSGCGKTHKLLDEFEHSLKESTDPLAQDRFFLLPSAEHTERVTSLIMQRGVTGFFHRRISTLSRLIQDVFAVGDDGVATNVTRYLILREILSGKEWDYFKDVQQSPGFLNLMLSFIMELKEAMITAPDLRARMNQLRKLEPDLSPKYEALAGIYEAYQAALEDRGLRDRQDSLLVYLERNKDRKDPPVRFKHLYLDGFFDFSELQLAYLRELTAMSEEVTVTLTLDPDPARRHLFETVRETQAVLESMGFKTQAMKRRADSGTAASLVHIEKNIFSENKPVKKPSPGDNISVFEAIGLEGEIEMIARAIEKMRRAEDIRYSDFAVLLRQIGPYDAVIRSVFARYGIPVEIHERERLSFSPALQVLTRLLQIFREDWPRYTLIDFLKSSYVDFIGEAAKDYEWVSGLENRAVSARISRGRERWKDFDAGLAPLLELEDRMRKSKTAAQMGDLLAHAAAKTFRIFKRENKLSEFTRRDAAGERRFYAILDEIKQATSRMPEITFEQFTDRFFRLVDLDLYSLHERNKNRVQVYDVSLARQKEYRVVFAAGLLERRFPVLIKEDPVLSDWERRLLNEKHTEHLFREKLPRQSLERYLFYLAVTRAKEKLFLTYPSLDLEGKEALPSYYVQEVAGLFENPLTVKQQQLGRPYPELEEAVNGRELEMAVMGELWNPQRQSLEKEPLLLAVTNELLSRSETRSRMERAFHEVRDELTDEAILAKNPFQYARTSPTRLEEYAKCHFKYYAKRVLKLDDPEEDLNVMLKGTILHDVLEQCFKHWIKNPDFLKNRDKALKMAYAELERALAAHPLCLEKKYQYDLEEANLKETLMRFITNELARLEGNPLQPRYFEYSFGLPQADAPHFEIRAGGEAVRISGKIDRIDVDAEGHTGLVIDYKSSATFKPKDLELGIALQLPIYSLVMERSLGLEPAGAELYSIRGLDKKGFYHQAGAEYFPGLSGRRMILSDTEFKALLERSVNFIRRFALEMKAMNIEVKPRYCDPYCAFSSVCRIEKWKLPVILEEITEDDRKRAGSTEEAMR